MKSINFTKVAAAAALAIFVMLGSTELTNGQGNSGKNKNKHGQNEAKDARKLERQRLRNEQEKLRAEQMYQAEWQRRNTRIVRVRSGNDRAGGAGYYNGNANANTNRDGRYRIYRNGSYYNTNGQGVDLLRQAVNEGYRQGFEAGRNDRTGRRTSGWSNSTVYRSGTFGYQPTVNRSQYQFYFREGFQRGYQDGSNRQYQVDYDGDYQYGSRQGGSMNILSSILGSILNVQSY